MTTFIKLFTVHQNLMNIRQSGYRLDIIFQILNKSHIMVLLYVIIIPDMPLM